jgi:hypothetical protein
VRPARHATGGCSRSVRSARSVSWPRVPRVSGDRQRNGAPRAMAQFTIQSNPPPVGTTTTTTTTTPASGDNFYKDVALSPAEKAKAAAMAARGLDHRRRAEKDADSSLSTMRHRSLQFSISIAGDTTGAPLSDGNPATSCGGLLTCINGCRSRFYKVTGGTINDNISAYTCGHANFAQRLYAWKSSGSGCSTFTCAGTRATRFVVVPIVLCARTWDVFSRSVDV